MTHLHKVLVLCMLVLFVVFVVLALKTPTAEAPISEPRGVTREEMGDRNEDEIASPTQDTAGTPPAQITGVTLDLSDQGLREVPRSTFEQRNIEVLDLSDNMLTSVQAEIRQLGSLRILNLSNNTLTNIPAELGQLSKLEILDLSNNRLTGLPYELGNLTNLKTLDLRGNAYAAADLEVIKKGLSNTNILTD